MTNEQLFTLRFNFQNMLRLPVDPYDYNRIANILNIDDGDDVKKALDHFTEVNKKTAEELACKYDVDSLKNKELTVVFAGDSVTSDRLSYMNILKEVFAHNKGIKLLDSAVSGWRSGDIVQEIYPYILNKPSDVLVYAFGTNDVRTINANAQMRVTSEAEFQKNIAFVLSCVQERIIILNTLAPVSFEKSKKAYGENGWEFPKENWYAYNNIVRKTAAEHNCMLNDTEKLFDECAQNNIDVFHEDGVHLNETGQKLIAENLIKLLLKL